ncbi:MAG: hypothetical protein Q9183_001652 [Haloplaca sp. 2 TL-2023]
MQLIPVLRSFGGFILLLSSAVLLSTWNHGSTLRLAKHQPVTENPVFTQSLATASARTVDIPGYKSNLSEIHESTVLTKRAPTLTYANAVCKGRKLYNELILPAFEGSGNPGTEFGEKDINNGWTREETSRRIPLGFQEALKSIGKNVFPSIGEQLPNLDEIKHINLVQDKGFKNFKGKKQKAIPIKDYHHPHYECYYVPRYRTIISSDTRSPQYMLSGSNLSPEALKRRVPPLNRQSDVMWALYASISDNPAELRFIGRDNIINDDTRGIMNEVFANLEDEIPLVWPGVSFDIETDEAKALLAAPNGLATAYILADRARTLGRRKLSVRIWASTSERLNQGYRMLWDMEPKALGPEPSTPAPSLPPLPEIPPISIGRRDGKRGMHVTEVAGPLPT